MKDGKGRKDGEIRTLWKTEREGKNFHERRKGEEGWGDKDVIKIGKGR